MAAVSTSNPLPVIPDVKDFDRQSGSWFERIVFNNRVLVVFLCLLATLVLGVQATKLKVNANFERMIPVSNPYIKNYFEYKSELPGLGNAIRIVVENKKGSVYDPAFLERLRQLNDALYLTPGVDRSWMKSVWMPIVRWRQTTEEGVIGGPVMPQDYDGSAQSIEQLKANIAKAGIVGSLVALDGKSMMIVAPLLDLHPETGEPLNYGEFSDQLEANVRVFADENTGVYVVGFAKIVGDLIDGLREVMMFFGVSVLVAAIFVFLYTRCVRSTTLLVVVATFGVIWLLGLMQIFGYELDPYSILVPFLIFAIGLSHGAQKMNGILQDVGRGTHKYVAARYTFRRLFLAGLTALMTNIVGFAVLALIDIPVIRELAITTSMGVAVLVFTKLVLIPVSLSYIGVGRAAALRAAQEDDQNKKNVTLLGRLWACLDLLTTPRLARFMVVSALAVTAVMSVVMLDLKIGDLDPGAPELRQESRYNRDNAYITSHYGLSSDEFVVIMTTPPDSCGQYDALKLMDTLAQRLQADPSVQATSSLAEVTRFITAGMTEGSGKWLSISRDQAMTNTAVGAAMIARPDITNQSCSVSPLIAYLSDHKADTLRRVLKISEDFANEYNTPDGPQFKLVAGSAGIEAATNIEVERGIIVMYVALYGATALLCLMTFRSIRATIVAMIPLVITTLLCKALMVWLGIGLKVATLPVLAVGVGVGVDYALYLLSVQLVAQRRGATLMEAYRLSLDFTGRVVALVGLTMAAGVITWAWSPIKFQADMGILLTFMFVWNMLGALTLIPALSYFLLNPKKPQEELGPDDATAGI